MASPKRTLEQVLGGRSDANVAFSDLSNLLMRLGFNERIRGSHHTYRKAGVVDKINLQREGKHAKSYQVKQVRRTLTRYGLTEL